MAQSADSSDPVKPKYDDDNHYYVLRRGYPQDLHWKLRPLVYTPITRATEHWLVPNPKHRCLRFEEIFLKCAYMGGPRQANERCWREMEDFTECMWNTKQRERYEKIQEVRDRKKQYAPPPLQDIFCERHAR